MTSLFMSSASVVGTTKEGVPIVLLKEGTARVKGLDSLKNNVQAAKVVATMLKSVLGPRGMDKMLVDSVGDVTITNDGATILKEMDIQHPAAKIMVEIAKTVDNEVGDGTTSAVIIAGALLERAEELIEKGIHPTTIINGYRTAMRQSIEKLGEIAIHVNLADRAVLKDIAITSMQSKIISVDSDVLADLAVEAVLAVTEAASLPDALDGSIADVDNIKVLKKPGGSMRDSELISGIVVDKEVAHSEMPRKIVDARILLLNSALEVEKTEFDAKLSIDRPEQMKGFLDVETKLLKTMVEKVHNIGATVVFCQKGIDDIVAHYLSKAGIMAVKRVKDSDIVALSKSTGARIASNLDDLQKADLGYAQLVEEKKIELDKWVFVEKCKNPKAVSILLRGGSQRIVDEAERSIHDALMVVADVVRKPAIVAGGGSPESYLSQKLREFAASVPGREHYGILAFADAIESIPETLTENAGMDPIDTLTEIRSRQSSSNPWIGVDVKEMKIGDMWKKNVIEPLAVKEQVLKSATEAASMLLRIDDVLAAAQSAKS